MSCLCLNWILKKISEFWWISLKIQFWVMGKRCVWRCVFLEVVGVIHQPILPGINLKFCNLNTSSDWSRPTKMRGEAKQDQKSSTTDPAIQSHKIALTVCSFYMLIIFSRKNLFCMVDYNALIACLLLSQRSYILEVLVDLKTRLVSGQSNRADNSRRNYLYYSHSTLDHPRQRC